MTKQTDADLIRISIERPQTFAAVFERHAPIIQGWLNRRLGPSLGEELLAETFVRAFAARSRFDGSLASTARPWLFGIAANLVTDHHRREVRRLKAFARAESWAQTTSDPAPEIIVRLDAAADGPRIAAALGRLRKEERSVLLLVAWADLDYDETAAALGIPIGTVRSRLSRARSRLRDELSRTTHTTEEAAR